MHNTQWKYKGYIINFDPLINNKPFELSFVQCSHGTLLFESRFSKVRISLIFAEELNQRSILNLKQWYNIGLSINGREKYIDVINDDLSVVNNEVSFTCLTTTLWQLLNFVANPNYNA